MRTKAKLILIVFAASLLGGCMGFRGFVPGKDLHLKNFRQEITLPWGHAVLTADSVDTIVRSDSAPAISGTTHE